MRIRCFAVFALVCLFFPLAGTTAHASTATPSAAGGQLLAMQWDGRIHVSNPDGSDDRLLTPDWAGGDQYQPDWSPDSTQIAFSADADDGTRDIWLADVSSGVTTIAFDCAAPCVWADDPAFSPDGGSLAFERTLPNANGLSDSQLVILDLATGADTLAWAVTHPEETIYVPRWSPDGTHIVLELDRFVDGSIDATEITGSAIVVIDLASKVATPLTEMTAYATNPDWSPNGDLIVFAQSGTNGADGPYELFTIAPDGSDLTTITAFGPDGFQAIQPSFTPDGARIIFVKDEMWSNPVVATIALESGATVETAAPPVSGTHPRLSR